MANGSTTAWKVATGALVLFVASTGAMWGMVSVHADHPHKDSVSRTEFTMSQDSIERRLARIESKLDQVLKQ